MATKVLTGQELYDVLKAEVIARGSDIIDFNEGSMQDIIAGATTSALNEAIELLINEFLKTYFSSAEGTDLEYLAVDHFGTRFARPEATSATVDLIFSRANTDAGDVTIPGGTVVKTVKDANGVEVRFTTDETLTMTGLTLNIAATATTTGVNTNVAIGALTVIESALTDTSVVVTNSTAAAGGTDQQEDDEYRETISNLIDSLSGATESAIRGAVEAVPEITYVSIVTVLQKVINVDDFDVPYGTSFRIPYVTIYVADADGNYSSDLIAKAEEAISSVRAAGVKIEVVGAGSSVVDWTAEITLNPAGPNYAELSTDTTLIEEDMANYIDNILTIGLGFNRVTAKNYILSIWGPTGTNDITSIITVVPTGNIAGSAGVKLVSGDITIQ